MFYVTSPPPQALELRKSPDGIGLTVLGNKAVALDMLDAILLLYVFNTVYGN